MSGLGRTRAVLSVGSNVGDRLAHLASVIDGFTTADDPTADDPTADDEVVAVSPVYRTAPWGGVEQDDFYNITMIVTGRRDPMSWLRRGAELERAADRRRDVRWGPRTLDVDVVALRDEAGQPVFCDSAELTLPHPRAHERGFVLIPWLAADPDAVLDQPDGTSAAVVEVIAALDARERSAVVIAGVELPRRTETQ